jgi:elongation factor 1-beta
VKVFQQIKEAPPVEQYPFAYRWYKHIASYESEFSKLSGDSSKDFTAYGPGSQELPINPAKAPEKEAEKEEEDDDEVDLFGSDDEDDEENEKLKAARVEEYKKKKEGKVKPAAKSIVTLDVKPWGMSCQSSSCHENIY